jgi:hypothetical protein
MNMDSKKRKKRNDRTHAIYQLTLGKKIYIGITAKTCSTVLGSVKSRFMKHVYRARSENRPWPLYEAMRKHGPEAFEVEILETGRGKAWAHARERELIKKFKPKLNLA